MTPAIAAWQTLAIGRATVLVVATDRRRVGRRIAQRATKRRDAKPVGQRSGHARSIRATRPQAVDRKWQGTRAEPVRLRAAVRVTARPVVEIASQAAQVEFQHAVGKLPRQAILGAEREIATNAGQYRLHALST
jgi:hypothetical protein